MTDKQQLSRSDMAAVFRSELRKHNGCFDSDNLVRAVRNRLQRLAAKQGKIFNETALQNSIFKI